MRKKFSFLYPLTKTSFDSHRAGHTSYNHVTDLTITGITSYKDHRILDNIGSHYDFEIESVLYNGVNIAPVLEAFESLEKILAACINHIENLYEGSAKNFNDAIRMNPYMARIVSLPLRRKIN